LILVRIRLQWATDGIKHADEPGLSPGHPAGQGS
jgi:hypothetical protein